MIKGLPASIAFHAAIVGVGYVSWPFMTATVQTDSESIIVPIDLVDLGAFNNIAPVLTPEPEPQEEIAPEVPEEEPEPEEVPEPEPDPVDETLPEDEIETAASQAAEEEQAPEEVVTDLDAEPEPPVEEPEPKPEPEKPKPAVRKDDPLDDFLNAADSTFQSERQTRKRQPEPTPKRKPLLEDTPPKPQEVRPGAGERTANTARLESIMYSRILPCWDGVSDQPNPEKLNVQMNLVLKRDGTVDDLRLVSPGRRPLGNSPMGTAVDRALKAVRKCQPYNLPDDDYAEWREINVNLGLAFTPTNKK